MMGGLTTIPRWAYKAILAACLMPVTLSPVFARAAEPRQANQEIERPAASDWKVSQNRKKSRTKTPAPVTEVGDAGETVEADVSQREIAVTSAFTGKEIIVFGAIYNSRQTSPQSGFYDVVVVVEGAPAPLVARRKSNIAGLWMNTSSVSFDRVPSFYAISSTRPLSAVTDAKILDDYTIGFSHIRITPRHAVPTRELQDYRDAVIRLKKDSKLYIHEDDGVKFIGRSLFRSSFTLPANVPVGLLAARVYLFKNGELLSLYGSQLQLEREGLERWLFEFAHNHSFLYGLLAVFIAMTAGLIASEVSRYRIP